MRILILGGSQFLGRHLVDAALRGGHEVTLFNRGQTNPNLYPEVEELRGNRDGQLDALYGRSWDAVLDTSGYVPRVVRQSLDLLKDAVAHYVFISSISVYATFSQIGMDEEASLQVWNHEDNERVSVHYGALKAGCEQEVISVFGDRALVIRPGLIVGPHDPTERFTYWVRRFAQGGEVLVPGRGDFFLQFIDARDLAQWIVRMVEHQMGGLFNAAGPEYPLTMAQFIETLGHTISKARTVTWVSEAFLLANGVREFEELPLWISDKTNWPGFLTCNVKKAMAQGLTFRPLQETILDTLHWDEACPSESKTDKSEKIGSAGMLKDREAKLLLDWRIWPQDESRA